MNFCYLYLDSLTHKNNYENKLRLSTQHSNKYLKFLCHIKKNQNKTKKIIFKQYTNTFWIMKFNERNVYKKL